MNLKYVVDIEIEGIDHRDCPDYVDAFVGKAAYPRLGWVVGWLYNLIPTYYKTVDPQNGITCHHPRFFKLRRFLGPIVYRDCTEQELDEINDNKDFVYEEVQSHLY